MAYNFLNESMNNFLSSYTDTSGFMLSRTVEYSNIKDNFPFELNNTEQEIISHDFETYSKLMSFLSDLVLKTFILHGFMGSGKSTIVNTVPKVLNKSVLVFRINCFEATNLDDVLLSIYTKFIEYYNEKKVVLPKIVSNVFAEKVNAYIKADSKPILFIFESVDSEKYPFHADIINFIRHISQTDKVKVIITSRNLAANDLPNDSTTNFAVIKLAGKDEFISLLNKNGIESDEETYENAFVATKGHYLYMSLLINVIRLLNISLSAVYNDFSKKNLIIFDFLISKVLTLIPERFFKTLWFLSLIRLGVSEDFIISQKLASKDELEYLKERMLVCQEENLIYIKDYVKETIKKTISLQTSQDIHKYLHELYESQLPKKPNERDLKISRSTMRHESAYHLEYSEKASDEQNLKQMQTAAKKTVDYKYITYSKSIQKDWKFDESSVSSNHSAKPAPRGMETRIRNNMNTQKLRLTDDELKLLNKLNLNVPNAERITDDRGEDKYISLREEYAQARKPLKQNSSNTENKIETNLETLADVMAEAAFAEEEFNFEKALAIYSKAYNMTEFPGYNEAKPIIMMQTAICHRKMQNTDEALRCFNIAQKLYSSINPEKSNFALFNMAEIYSETYNHEQAKIMYEKILASGQTADLNFITKVLLNLAEIELNNSDFDKTVEYYTRALQYAEKSQDKKLICECTFKFALAYDDIGDIDKAYKNYVKCVQTSGDYEVNPYISSAYSNIAGIYEEQNLTDKAAKCYEEAIKADEAHENWDGLFFGYSKLASIYQTKSITLATDILKKALNAAKKLGDNVYIASTYTQLGDFYYQSNSNEDALKSYLLAKAVIIKQPNPENIRKIDVRINDMKERMGDSLYSKIISEIQGTV